MQQSQRVLTDDGFLAFFCQMPTMIDWCNQANQYFKFSTHITWLKRRGHSVYNLTKTHESIMIYRKKRAKFFTTKGKYSDLKVDALAFDAISLEAIKRYIADLNYQIKYGKGRMSIQTLSNNPIYNRYKNQTGKLFYKHSSNETNFTNVWSFAPHNLSTYNKGDKDHPTQKPIPLMERLIELLSDKDFIILDPFSGSGSTGIACKNLNRRYILVEKELEYFHLSQQRLGQEIEIEEECDIGETLPKQPFQSPLF